MNELNQLHADFKAHLENDNRNFSEIKGKLDVIIADQKKQGEALKPLTEAYQGVLFSRRFLMGLAGLVLAIGAIGAGMMWVVEWVRNKP